MKTTAQPPFSRLSRLSRAAIAPQLVTGRTQPSPSPRPFPAWRGGASSRGGFTVIEIMIVLALLALLAGIAIPNYLASQTEARKGTCINNLKEISYAVQQWALEQKKTAKSPVGYSDISPFLKGSVACPSGGKTFADSYTLSTVATDPSCHRQPQTHQWMDSTVIEAVVSSQTGATAVDGGKGR